MIGGFVVMMGYSGVLEIVMVRDSGVVVELMNVGGSGE